MAITSTKQEDSTPLTPLPPPTPPPPAKENISNQQQMGAAAVSDYEQIREQRIKENQERLQKLGILNLSLQVKSLVASSHKRAPYERKTPLKSPPLGPPEPRRRSSRLQSVPAATYVEPKEEKVKRSRDIVLEEGAKPEIYTEEHEKLLGHTETPWELFVDGVGADGKRIYDPVNGKTCHQCRQKTLGKRTHCVKCNLVQGQFCGDCLYMRYGENVLEVNQNPHWICPPCRGICNCSLCRQAKGWAPTGTLYRRISSLGYKSVAHFLVATRRATSNSEDLPDTQKSAKRSLPFEGMELPDDNSSDKTAVDVKTEINLLPEDNAVCFSEQNPNPDDSRLKKEAEEENGSVVADSARNTDDTATEPVSDPKSPAVVKRPVGRPRKRSKIEDVGAAADSGTKDISADAPVSEMNDPTSQSPKADSVARRLRSKKENVGAVAESGTKDVTADAPASVMNGPTSESPKVDSIARRLRSRSRT